MVTDLSKTTQPLSRGANVKAHSSSNSLNTLTGARRMKGRKTIQPALWQARLQRVGG